MSDEKRFFTDVISRAHFPAPSPDLHARIMNGIAAYTAVNISRADRLKISLLSLVVVLAAFTAGFTHPAPANAEATPYYSGTGVYIVKYLGS